MTRSYRTSAALLVALTLAICVPAYAQTTTRVSVSSNGTQAVGSSSEPSMSADGRYVAFASFATNLVANDVNGVQDIFVHDRQTNTTERVNLGLGVAQATGGPSFDPSLSADGRFVAFYSYATNLVVGDSNGDGDVFVRDRQTGVTTRVSVTSAGTQVSGDSDAPSISADGRYVAFVSLSANLVPGDTNGTWDIFVRDRQAGTTVRASVSTGGAQGNGMSNEPSISADGRAVTFHSEATLVAGDTNGTLDIFVRDLQTSTTTRVSVGPGGAQSNQLSENPTISADGRFVAFTSFSSNFDDGRRGVFVHDRQTGVTSPLAVIPVAPIDQTPHAPKISGNGQLVCYIVLRPGTMVYEAWAADRLSPVKTRVSVSTTGGDPDKLTQRCEPNHDGSIFALSSIASNLVPNDTNDSGDVFVRTKPSTMSIDKTSLAFGAVTSGATFVTQTAAQTVRLTRQGGAPVTWSAASSQPWLQVSPAAGTGSALLSISVTPVAGLPASGSVSATLVFSLTNSANTLPPITVTLTLVPHGTSAAPFGVVDTPADHRTGVTGAVPFTGWALDDIEVTQVSICRAAFGSEVPPFDPNCAGAAEIFVGFAVFIDGARPDVQGAFPSYPLASRAGWGFMVLTNMLPNQGNGTYSFAMRAQDREGQWFLLGTRTMTCANASATLPFGTLDTPLQGGLASGTDYINFGWALTPQPKTIPIDGSTMQVLIDGVKVGTVDYNHVRPDIQALFPGYNNTNGAVGFKILNTASLTNGQHTISWTVSDNAGAIEGLGSRYFTVSNGSSAVTAAASSVRVVAGTGDTPVERSPVAGRRGWDLGTPYRWFGVNEDGVTLFRIEEVSRVELLLGEGNYTGYLRTPSGRAPLPIGSRLDPSTNTFTWAPGVGFIGSYDFTFVRSVDGRAVSHRHVRIFLQPKGRGSVGPQVAIHLPKANAVVQQPFMIGGWAADLDAPVGTGVSTLHAWAYPAAGGAPIFLGATVSGGARLDVAAVHGDQFKESGFGLIVHGLAAGDYDLAIFAWSTETMGFVAPKVVRVRVAPL